MSSNLDIGASHSSTAPIAQNRKVPSKLLIILGVSALGILVFGLTFLITHLATKSGDDKGGDQVHSDTSAALKQKLEAKHRAIKGEIDSLEKGDFSVLPNLKNDIELLKNELANTDTSTRADLPTYESNITDLLSPIVQEAADKIVLQMNKGEEKKAAETKDLETELENLYESTKNLGIPIKAKLTLKAYQEIKNSALESVESYLRSFPLMKPESIPKDTEEKLNSLLGAIPRVIERDTESPSFTKDDDTFDKIIGKIYVNLLDDLVKYFSELGSEESEQGRKEITSGFALLHGKYGIPGPVIPPLVFGKPLIPSVHAALEESFLQLTERLAKQINPEDVDDLVELFENFGAELKKFDKNLIDPKFYDLPFIISNSPLLIELIKLLLAKRMEVEARLIYDTLKIHDNRIAQKFGPEVTEVLEKNFIDLTKEFAPKSVGSDYHKCISENLEAITLLMEKKAPMNELTKPCDLLNECIRLRDESVIDTDFPTPISTPDLIESLSNSHSATLLKEVEHEFLGLFKDHSSLKTVLPSKERFLNVSSFSKKYRDYPLDDHLIEILLKTFYKKIRENLEGQRKIYPQVLIASRLYVTKKTNPVFFLYLIQDLKRIHMQNLKNNLPKI